MKSAKQLLRFPLRKKFNYQELLKDASKGIALIQSLENLAKLIVTFLTLRARIKNAALYIRSDEENLFYLKAWRGYPRHDTVRSFSSDHPLIVKLNSTHQPLRMDSLKNASKRNENLDTTLAMEAMESIAAEIVIPSFLGMQPNIRESSPDRGLLRSFLVLGAKKSNEAYSAEDIDVFFTIAQESAIAIENARLYDEAIKRAKELEKINSELNAASSRLMRALSETEEANKRLKDTQSQLVHEQKMATMGRLAASVGHEVNNPLTVLSMNISRVLLRMRREPHLKVQEILPVFDKMEHNIQRIKAVVNTLTGLLKKSEKGRFEALSIKILIEETLPLVQFQTYLDNLSGTEVVFDIPGDIALVKGDLERLQEVFLNLFINAYQAMINSTVRRISIVARNDEAAKMVNIEFTDTGEGMSEEIMNKLFQFRFTTKPEGKGSGIGLYMCRYILELHGGTIAVKSKLGSGATFTVRLPIYDEKGTFGVQDQAQRAAG
ncbi:MAG: HAMP domain-containing histidine kinase [Candidatus Omnitrophica bacterium]|nr:HAMP domain-containing histidine kinase [Candidatus Omnitrophota bacterium]